MTTPARQVAAMDSLAGDASRHPRWIWRCGALVPWQDARVHVNAVGHASVAAVFEGIKAYRAEDGKRLVVFRLDDHLRRLLHSARICRLDLPYPLASLREAVLELLRANECREDTYLRPWVFPRGVIREQMVPANARSEVIVDSWPFRSRLRERRGCRAAVSSWVRVGDASMPPRAKAFSNYHNGRLAVIEARENGHDWPILLNDRYKVSEGPGACVALVRDGVLITPTLTSGVLESLTRATVLTLARELGIPVEQRDVDRSELYLAEEIFFMGTGWEILPVSSVDGLQVGDGAAGPVTARLEREYAAVVRAADERHPEWLTSVAIRAAEKENIS